MKVGPGEEAYCVSLDTSTLGFRCFQSSNWVSDIASFLSLSVSGDLAPGLHLNRTTCENLDIGESSAGIAFMNGKCCVGQAVPCQDWMKCADGFTPLGPSVMHSILSIMMFFCAFIHLMSCVMCMVFADRLMSNMEDVQDMSEGDRISFKNIINMLGAAHGAFTAVLVFGALQDWLYGKSQIALAAVSWYAIFGPCAEAMQHGKRPYGIAHYLSECLSASQGACGGNPPKLTYSLLCILLVACIAVETYGVKLWIAGGMTVVGFIASMVISQVRITEPALDEDADDSGARNRKRISDINEMH